MARPKRIDLPFSLFHVVSRTNSGGVAFIDSRDQDKFLYYLSRYAEMYHFKIHAWCLMSNHFHLLLESTVSPALSSFMHRMLTAYTVYFNRRHGLHGHLFQGRFKSYIVEKADYLLALSRYIHLNPVGGSRRKNPETYRGSSLRFYIKGNEPPYLCTSEILRWFGGDRKKYAAFIREGLDEEIKPVVIGQRCIGGVNFARRVIKRQERMNAKKGSQRASRENEDVSDVWEQMAEELLHTVADRFDLSEKRIRCGKHAHGKKGLARNLLIYLLRQNLPWTIDRIASFMNIRNRSGVYARLKRVEQNGDLLELCQRLKNISRKSIQK